MKQWIGLGLLFVLFTAAVGYFLGLYQASLENTLENNGQWIVTKTTHELGVMGEGSYLTELQALAGNQLHLHPWHGYQEVYHRDAFRVDALQCTVMLSELSWGFVLLRTSPDEAAYGLRLSTDDAFPMALFRISPEGVFLDHVPLNTPTLTPGAYGVELRREEQGLEILLNGERKGLWEGVADAPFHIGFRGNDAPVSIDNVTLSHGGEVLLEEDFSQTSAHPQVVYNTALLLVLGATLLLIAVAAISRKPLLALKAFAALSVCGLAAAAPLYLVGAPLLAMRYPPLDQALQTKEQAWLETAFDTVADRIKADFPDPHFAEGPTVVILGTSQTFGGGARTVAESFTAVAHRHVKAEWAQPVRIIQAGIPGVKTPILHQFYEKHLRAYAPCLIVLNVGVNDSGNPEFKADLQAMIDVLKADGVYLSLSREAHNWPHPTLTHDIMETLAAENDLTALIMNPHSRLAREGNSGLLWWDFVHPTSYGHRLLGEYFGTELLRILPDLDCKRGNRAILVSP